MTFSFHALRGDARSDALRRPEFLIRRLRRFSQIEINGPLNLWKS
jgi:hypothetical protein